MQDEWLIWRIVKERMATLHELSTVYDFEDLLKMNAILDMRDDIEAQMNAEAEAKSKRRGGL
jgi:hypothetical protein